MSMTQETKGKSISFQEMLVLLKKHLILIVIAGLIGGMVTYCVYSFFVPPVYQASAKMIVNSRQEHTGSMTSDQIVSSQRLVNTYAIIIRSQSVLDPVIEKLQLSVEFEQLAKMVTVVSVNDTQVMQISVQSTDPDLALNIVAEIVNTCPEIIIDAVEAGSVKTVEAAHLRRNPVGPNTNLYTLVAAFLCMFAVVAFVVIRFVMDNTYKSEVDLRDDLGMPVLGVIPDFDSCMKTADGKEGYRYGKV